jgi:hypothetical protein
LKFDGTRKAFAIHTLLWISFYLGFTAIMAFYGDWQKYLLVNSVTTILFMGAYYPLRYWQIPYLYKKGKIFLFAFTIIGSMLLCYSLYWGFRVTILERLRDLYPERPFK